MIASWLLNLSIKKNPKGMTAQRSTERTTVRSIFYNGPVLSRFGLNNLTLGVFPFLLHLLARDESY